MNPYEMTPQERVAYCGQLLDSMRVQVMEPKTVEAWSPERTERLRSIATGVKLNNGQIRPGVFENGNND